MKIYKLVTELWCVQAFYDIQRGITQKLRRGEQSFLCGKHCLDLLYISIKYHEDILKIVYGQRKGQTGGEMDSAMP